MRELSRETAQVFDRLQREQRPLLVSRQGAPVAALVPLSEDRLEQFLRQTAPGVAEAVDDAHDAVREGRTRPLSEIEARLRAEAADTAGEQPVEVELSFEGESSVPPEAVTLIVATMQTCAARMEAQARALAAAAESGTITGAMENFVDFDATGFKSIDVDAFFAPLKRKVHVSPPAKRRGGKA